MSPTDRRAFLGASLVLGLSLSGASRCGSPIASPRPLSALTYAWRNAPWARGAYSALPPGVPASVRSIIARSVIRARIVFAGEYTAEEFPGTTTGAYWSGVAAAQTILDAAQPRRVIVVGAGMAGAAAARILTDAGVEVLVVEASDRIGGRIHADTSWGVPVELGASWIHGVDGNPLTTMAQAAGLGLQPTDYDNSIVRDTMTGSVSTEGERAQTRMTDWLSGLEDSQPPQGMSVGTWLSRRGWIAGRFDDWAAAVEVTQEYGLDPAALGVEAVTEGAELRGGDVMVTGNYAQIPISLLDGVEIRYDTAISRIIADRQVVRVINSRGESLDTDAVVVAVPLEILKQGVLAIEPLSAPVRTALDSLRTGELQKVVLRYEERWWDEVDLIGVVGGGVPGAPNGSEAALRWTEFYDMTKVLGFPVLAGFSGGAAAMSLPPADSFAIDGAATAITTAYGR